jgi:hypothetical protein
MRLRALMQLRAHGLLACLVLLSLLACGKRGDPLAPLRKTPPPVSGLKLAQRGEQIEIAYQVPRSSVDGAPLPQLDMELLVAQGDGDFEKLAVKKTRQESPGVAALDLLPLPAPGTTVRVALRALAKKRPSARTPISSLTAVAPPIGPNELKLALSADGVALSWKGPRPAPMPPPPPTPVGPPAQLPRPGTRTAPTPGPAPSSPPGPATAKPTTAAASTKDAPPPPPFGGGFSVYRRSPDGAYGAPLAPPIDQKSFIDGSAPIGQTVCYVVRAVARLVPLVESAASDEACVAVADITAPAAPTGLSVMPVGEGLELSWSPSPEGDLAGYRISRASGPGAPEPLAEAAPNQTQYIDKTAVRGIRYRYRLVAFDQAGNASDPSDWGEGALP